MFCTLLNVTCPFCSIQPTFYDICKCIFPLSSDREEYRWQCMLLCSEHDMTLYTADRQAMLDVVYKVGCFQQFLCSFHLLPGPMRIWQTKKSWDVAGIRSNLCSSFTTQIHVSRSRKTVVALKQGHFFGARISYIRNLHPWLVRNGTPLKVLVRKEGWKFPSS